jgi:hypothetical protein
MENLQKELDYILNQDVVNVVKKKKYYIDDVKKLLDKNKYFNILPFDNYTGYRQKIKVICKKENHSSIKSISHLLNNNVNCSFCSKKYKYNQNEWIDNIVNPIIFLVEKTL